MNLKQAIAMLKVKNVDADVFSGYKDSVLPAICGEIELTHEGYRQFQVALDLPVEVYEYHDLYGGYYEIVEKVYNDFEESKLHEFCYAQAGYIGEARYNTWFK